MQLSDVLRARLTPEGQEIYDGLSPIRQRQAMQMMASGAFMTNMIHVEQFEQILAEADMRMARAVANIYVPY